MNSKRSLVFVSLLGVSLPVVAGDLNQIQALSQAQFRALSEDLGAALSYKPLTPTTPLGITGFDLGIAATVTKRLNKGLPFDIDVGLMYSSVPGTNIRLVGGELRYAIVSGGAAMPAIGIRGSYTKLSGVDQLDFDTKGLDLSISKGFLMFTPYAGVGKVWVASTPKSIPTSTPTKESLSLNKVYVGINMNFGLTNLAFEGDRTGQATSYGAKLGFRF